MEQVTTLTLFKYSNLWTKIWAFHMMLLMPSKLKRLSGQTFFRLMGSGKNGFEPSPDWSVYALIQVWENEKAADLFFNKSKIITRFQGKASDIWTVYLKNITSKGLWTGCQPFTKSDSISSSNNAIVVITRATIKLNRLVDFWKYVPKSRTPLRNQKGLIFAKGIGAKPFIQMATFSLWNDKKALLDYAYKTSGHKEAIRKTRILDWYHEELFARFQPYKTMGKWENINPVIF